MDANNNNNHNTTSSRNDDPGSVFLVQKLNESAAFILRNNFDTVTKPCFITLLKLLDNILQKPLPNNLTVRRIKLTNPAIQQKIVACQGGVPFLQVCGFTPEPPLLPNTTTNIHANSHAVSVLILQPEHESTSLLVAARHLLHRHCVKDLGCSLDELPSFQPPRAPVVLLPAGCGSGGGDSFAFNPYQGRRFDALSAAVGARLGPDEINYVSKTETELAHLQARQAKLQAKLQRESLAFASTTTTAGSGSSSGYNREWSVLLPGQQQSQPTASSSLPHSSDASLLAARAQTQTQNRILQQQQGFTTAAMRDLEKIKRTKVYSHVAVRIQCPDGTQLTGKFLPSETVGLVATAIRRECFSKSHNSKNEEQDWEFDLYVTPPRRLLPPNLSLTEAGLVPAAKIFLSWNTTAPPNNSRDASTWLNPELVAKSIHACTGRDINNTKPDAPSLFPASLPVVPSTTNLVDNDIRADKKAKRETSGNEITKEHALLRRMMGGKLPRNNNNNEGSEAKKPATDQPKWFKR